MKTWVAQVIFFLITKTSFRPSFFSRTFQLPLSSADVTVGCICVCCTLAAAKTSKGCELFISVLWGFIGAGVEGVGCHGVSVRRHLAA